MPENSPVNGLSRPFRASPLSRTVLLRTGVLGAFAAAKRRPRKRRFFFVGNESRLMQQKARGKGQISVGNAKRQKKEGKRNVFFQTRFLHGLSHVCAPSSTDLPTPFSFRRTTPFSALSSPLGARSFFSLSLPVPLFRLFVPSSFPWRASFRSLTVRRAFPQTSEANTA